MLPRDYRQFVIRQFQRLRKKPSFATLLILSIMLGSTIGNILQNGAQEVEKRFFWE
jgi:hypothetical protein